MFWLKIMKLFIFQPFTTPSFDDKILEVMAVYGSAHIGVSRFINLHYHRIAQVSILRSVLESEQ